MTHRIFARARWTVLAAAVLGAGSIARYPGGNRFEPTRTHYSLTSNFLSDLGMTAVYGRPNVLGALLFAGSLVLLVLGMGASVVGFAKILSRSPHARGYARAAGAVTFIACAAFTGVAITPENTMMPLHLGFTLFAFRIMPAAALLLAVASARAPVIPTRVTIAWTGLTVALIFYAAFLSWGPSVATPQGLAMCVIAQKVIATIVVAGLLYITSEAERLA